MVDENSKEEWQEMLNVAVFTGIQNALNKQKKLEKENEIRIVRKLLENYHYLMYFIGETTYEKEIVTQDYIEYHMRVLLDSLKIDIELTTFYIDRLDFSIKRLEKKCEFDCNREDFDIFYTYYLDKKNIHKKMTYRGLSLQFDYDTRTISRKLNNSTEFVCNCFFGKLMRSIFEVGKI